MSAYKEATKLAALIKVAKRIVILQADNPDGDSLGSALALEELLGDLKKEVFLYCSVNIPTYLHYFNGWDRVQTEFPTQFDLSIIVDTSSKVLLENLGKLDFKRWLATKPTVVIDHHNVKTSITGIELDINYPVVATAELIYELAQQLNWPINLSARYAIYGAIMSDSLGLTTEATTARSIEIVSELVAGGVKVAEFDNKRRDLGRKSPDLVKYKGELLQRVEYYNKNTIAIISIPWEEIEKYSHAYNPSMLVLDDMRQTENTVVAIAFKLYNDGRITAKIRANFGYPIAGVIAEHFGGGGHKYASGFRINNGKKYDKIKSEVINLTTEIISNQGR